MTEEKLKRSVKKEIKRLKDLLTGAGIEEAQIEALITIIENTAWMKVQLDEARDTIKTAQIVIAYDNGGGQKGIRENPLFKAYESLWKSYVTGISKILDVMPKATKKEEVQEAESPKSVLALVRAKHA